jgi:sugar lactone lactonase YvrE
MSYSTTGAERWTAETDGGASCLSFVRDVVTDSARNTIVVGALVDSTGKRDFFTTKYDASGVQLWYTIFDGITDGDDGAFAATLDANGNIYVTGSSEGFEYDTDYLTIKYNSSGVEQWSERFHSSVKDSPYHIQVDTEGNIVVAGYPALVKYDPDGLLLWAINTGERPVSAMALDDSGSILVVNQLEEYLRKYNGSGGLVWSAHSEAVDLALGDDGSVFTSWALGTRKYDSDGGMMWDKPIEGGNWVKVADGRVIVGGYDSLFVLTEDGIVEWRRPDLPGLVNTDDVAAIGPDGSIYLTGMELDDDNDATGRLHIVNYSTDGNLLCSGHYDDVGRGEFHPFYISADADGDVIVVGERTGKDYSTSPFIVKLNGNEHVVTGITHDQGPYEFSLSQNYPNPFNATSNFGFRISSLSDVSLKVFDLLGQEVATIVNERLAAGSYTRRWDAAGLPSGIYFYRLQAGNFSETRKLILLR